MKIIAPAFWVALGCVRKNLYIPDNYFTFPYQRWISRDDEIFQKWGNDSEISKKTAAYFVKAMNLLFDQPLVTVFAFLERAIRGDTLFKLTQEHLASLQRDSNEYDTRLKELIEIVERICSVIGNVDLQEGMSDLKEKTEKAIEILTDPNVVKELKERVKKLEDSHALSNDINGEMEEMNQKLEQQLRQIEKLNSQGTTNYLHTLHY